MLDDEFLRGIDIAADRARQAHRKLGIAALAIEAEALFSGAIGRFDPRVLR